MTLAMIDRVHQRPTGTARRCFNHNRKRFIDGTDYFGLNQPNEIRSLGITRPQGGTPAKALFLTESGYLMIAKSFTDDLSWQVQRELVNTYFKHEELVTQIAAGEILPPQGDFTHEPESLPARPGQRRQLVYPRRDKAAPTGC